MDPLRSLAERSRALGSALQVSTGVAGVAPQRDFSQLFDDAERLAAPPLHANGHNDAVVDMSDVPPDVVNRAQRLLLSTGTFDVQAAERDAQELQFKVRSTVCAYPPSVLSLSATLACPPLRCQCLQTAIDGGAGYDNFAPSVDVGEFVERVQNAAVGSAIVDAQNAAARRMELISTADAGTEWELAKDALLAALGLGVYGGVRQSSSSAPNDKATSPLRDARYGDARFAATNFGVGGGDSSSSRSPLDSYAAPLGRVAVALAAASQAGSTAALPPSESSSFGVIRALAEVAEAAWAGAPEDVHTDVSQHTRFWRLLQDITREGSAGGGVAGAFNAEYLGGGDARRRPADLQRSASLPISSAMADAWAVGALSYLGSLFRHILELTVATHADVARVASAGGSGLLPTVRGYLNVLLDRHRRSAAARDAATLVGRGGATAPAWYEAACRAAPLAGGHPLYPQVYLLLRAGARRDALALLVEAASSGAVDGDLVTALVAISEVLEAAEGDAANLAGGGGTRGAAATAAEAALAAGAGRAIAHVASAAAPPASQRNGPHAAVDPFQVEVACLLGLVDPEAPSDGVVLRTKQDYVWHRLWFALTAPVAPRGSEPYSLWELSEAVLEDGEATYDPTGLRAYAYAEVLLLAAQPEMAVAFLACKGHAEAPERHLHDAVHLALALSRYGLLRTIPARLAKAASARGGDRDDAALPAGAVGVDGTGGLLYSMPLDDEAAAASGRPPAAHRLPVLLLDLTCLLSVYAARVLRDQPALTASYFALVPQRHARCALLARLLVYSAAFVELAGPLDTATLSPMLSRGALARHGSAVPVTPPDEVMAIVMEAGRELRDSGRGIDALGLFLRCVGSYEGLDAAMSVALSLLVERLATPPQSASAAAAERAAVRDVVAALTRVPLPPPDAAAGGMSLGGAMMSTTRSVAADGLTAHALGVKQRGLHVALNLCAFYDALDAARWHDALAWLDAAGVIPPPAASASESGWAAAFDPLAPALRDAFGAVLTGAMRAIRGAYVAAIPSAEAATGISRGRALAEAVAAADTPFAAPALQALRDLKLRVRCTVHVCP